MGYQMASGRWANTADVTAKASSATTATGQTTGVEVGDAANVRLLLDVTVVAGTNPTLDVVVETSYDNSTWRTGPGSFAQKTAAATERKSFYGLDRFIRLNYTIGGTGSPSFTWSCIGEAV